MEAEENAHKVSCSNPVLTGVCKSHEIGDRKKKSEHFSEIPDVFKSCARFKRSNMCDTLAVEHAKQFHEFSSGKNLKATWDLGVANSTHGVVDKWCLPDVQTPKHTLQFEGRLKSDFQSPLRRSKSGRCVLDNSNFVGEFLKGLHFQDDFLRSLSVFVVLLLVITVTCPSLSLAASMGSLHNSTSRLKTFTLTGGPSLAYTDKVGLVMVSFFLSKLRR